MPPTKAAVRVPATTANIGPGFDCLGIALDLYNEVHVALDDAEGIEIEGEGAPFLPRGEGNLVLRSVQALFSKIGQPAPKLSIRCSNGIPLTRGLGSSAAAVVGGLVAANVLAGDPLSPDEVLAMATEIEGHPDNVAPALLGGCQIVVDTGSELVTSGVSVAGSLAVVLFVPDAHMSTKQARSVLPRRVPRQDAIFNVGRVALLVNALATGKWENLVFGTEDRLHQPYRRALFPVLDGLISAAGDAGARGAFLSGAGPTVAAFASERADDVAVAMAQAADVQGVDGLTRIVAIDVAGAQLMEV